MNLYGYGDGDPINNSDPFGLCPTKPFCPRPVRPGMLMGAALNGVGQTAEREESKLVVTLVVSTFAPEASAVRLFRFARGAESATRLARQASQAESAGLPHGVSVTSRSMSMRRPDAEVGPGALIEEVQKFFRVQKTGGPGHYTVELPKPVTKEAAEKFNELFRQP